MNQETNLKAGDRVRLVSMADDPDPIPAGATGTVARVILRLRTSQSTRSAGRTTPRTPFDRGNTRAGPIGLVESVSRKHGGSKLESSTHLVSQRVFS